jgi:metal-responsive CopG/Arc/MetJ family transcriptional regulator
MKTAISLPDSLFSKAEEAAHRLGLTRSKLFSLAIDEFLRRRIEENVTKALDEIYSEENSHLDHTVEDMQARSVPEEQW